MASVPKGKRGAAAVVVKSEGQRVEANVLNKQGEVVGREVLTHTPNKSFIVPDSESSSRVVNDVWHRLFPIGVSADDQAAIRKHNGQQNRNARKRRRGDPEAAAEMEAAATRTLEEKAAEDRAKEEKAAENRAKDAARKREARQAGKADVHKVQPRVDPTPLSPARAKVPSPPPPTPPQSHGTTRIRRLREAEKALDEYTERSEERRAKDAYLEHLQGEVRAVFADDTKPCAYLSFRHAGAHLEGKWGLEKDQAQAKALFRQAASMGHSEAAYQLGLLLTEEGDWSTAFTAFEQASRPCNCWTKGSCATDAYKDPHFKSDHRQVFRAQLKVAEMTTRAAGWAAVILYTRIFSWRRCTTIGVRGLTEADIGKMTGDTASQHQRDHSREMCGSATHLRGRWLRMATCLSI